MEHDSPGWQQPPEPVQVGVLPPPLPAGGEGDGGGGGGQSMWFAQHSRQSGSCMGVPDSMGQPVPNVLPHVATDHALQSRGGSQLGSEKVT